MKLRFATSSSNTWCFHEVSMTRRSVAESLPSLKMLALLGMLASATTVLHAQIDTNPGINAGASRPGVLRNGNDDDPLRDNPEMRDRLQKGRASDRQRRIVDDANRLVALTAQYRKALDAHGTPTEDDQKLLAQIEKLARDVKDRMRGM